jgi:hypothetical protein
MSYFNFNSDWTDLKTALHKLVNILLSILVERACEVCTDTFNPVYYLSTIISHNFQLGDCEVPLAHAIRKRNSGTKKCKRRY